MRKVGVEFLTIGDVLARPIFSSEGQILLGKDMVLTAGYISKLVQMGIRAVYIRDDDYADLVIEDPITDETKREAIKVAKTLMEDLRQDRELDVRKVKGTVDQIIEDVLNQQNVLINLVDIRGVSDWLFAHSVNTSVIAAVIGASFYKEPGKLQELVMGALLHDAGKARMDREMFNKPEERWNEEERKLYKGHSLFGFNQLRKFRDLSTLVYTVALQHHENWDGSGYPQGLSEEGIHLNSRITAVANLYDRLTAGVPGIKPVLPHEACEILMGLSGKQLDFEVVRVFLKNVAVYPTGSSVRLSNGEVGVVVDQNRSMPMRPVVRVIHRQQDHVDMKEYDLCKNFTLFVKEVVS